MFKKLLIVALITIGVISCATSPTGRSQFMAISPEKAISESEKAYLSTVNELDQKDQLVNDPQLVSRVRNITGRLVTEAIRMYPKSQRWKWSVAIIDDPETLNAWCMAGGRMAIYTGIITKLNLTDDELAQIMGHEIAHALANHTAERMSRAMLINAGLIAAAKLSENNQMVLGGSALAAKLALELPNSRTAETEAERIGTELAARAGYNPKAAVTLWGKMAKAGGGGTPEFLSTHPSSKNRSKELGKLAPQMLQLNPSLKKATIYPIDIVK